VTREKGGKKNGERFLAPLGMAEMGEVYGKGL
jgi:hypothetical protein